MRIKTKQQLKQILWNKILLQKLWSVFEFWTKLSICIPHVKGEMFIYSLHLLHDMNGMLQVEMEIQLHRKLNHPNVVQFIQETVRNNTVLFTARTSKSLVWGDWFISLCVQ